MSALFMQSKMTKWLFINTQAARKVCHDISFIEAGTLQWQTSDACLLEFCQRMPEKA